MPAAERREGFVGSMMTSSNEADMLASESGEYLQEQIAQFITLRAGPPAIEHRRVDMLS